MTPQAAAGGKSKETGEGTKGRVRETEGRQRDASLGNKAAVATSSGQTLFETWELDSQSNLKITVKLPGEQK
jgi:hypothetical protein